MSAPGQDEDRRGFLDSPRWMDGDMALLAAGGFAVFSVLIAIGLLVLGVLVAVGRISSLWLVLGIALAGLAVLCAVLYRGTIRRTAISVVPKDAPSDRLFPVVLMARGGWLRQYLEPAVGASAVLEDDGLRLCFRRPMNQFMLVGFVFQFAGMGRHIGLHISDGVSAAGMMLCMALYVWSCGRRYDLRFPWARVLSVAAGKDRFHVRLDDEEWPDGFLLQVQKKSRETVAALFAGRTLFHDEDAAAAGVS
ncbi:MAG TPA: hypothetical protein VFS92_04275 [Planctomycetota bacterium]|nr:hypothetical protein [Planctomycetota bacterium]